MERSDCCMIWWWDLHQRLKYSMDNMQPIISWGIRCLLLTKSSIVILHFSCSSTSWQEPAVLGWSEHVSIAMAASYLCNLETIVFNFYCLRFTDWRMKAESRLCRKTTINYVEQRTDHFCRIGCWWKETRDFSRSDIELKRDIWFWFVFLTVASVGSDFKFPMRIGCWIEQF